MSLPPDVSGPPPSWMTVSDVFHITGRGTVITGQLQGNMPLNVGDVMVCEDQHWPVGASEQFSSTTTTAMPGANVGVLLRHGPPGDVLRGATVRFEPGSVTRRPTFAGLRTGRRRRG